MHPLLIVIIGLTIIAGCLIGYKILFRRRVYQQNPEGELVEVRAKIPWKKYSTFGGGLFILLLAWCLCVKIIPASTVGVMKTFGEVDRSEVLPEGIHIISPITSVVKVPVSVQTSVIKNASAASKDLQTVTATLTVNYEITPNEAISVYVRNPDLAYESQFIIPAVHESLKSVVAQYTATDIIVKRQEVSDKLTELLREKLSKYHLNVQDINIANFDFSEVFNTAIEQKMKASQEAEKAKFDLEKVQTEAKQKVVAAEADARAIDIKTRALMRGGKDYVKLEAINKWDGHMPQIVGQGTMPMIQLGGK